MNDRIFGLTWEQIQLAQQRKPFREHTPLDNDSLKTGLKIQSDVNRFKIDVHASVKEAYAITLPEGYTLHGDTWKFSI